MIIPGIVKTHNKSTVTLSIKAGQQIDAQIIYPPGFTGDTGKNSIQLKPGDNVIAFLNPDGSAFVIGSVYTEKKAGRDTPDKTVTHIQDSLKLSASPSDTTSLNTGRANLTVDNVSIKTNGIKIETPPLSRVEIKTGLFIIQGGFAIRRPLPPFLPVVLPDLK